MFHLLETFLGTRSHHPPFHTNKSEWPAHTPGTNRGEGWVERKGREPGRKSPNAVRTARDSTGIEAERRDPIDPRMPFIPPA
jgi:hypothetical protein